jgi:pectin lyase
MVYIKANEYPDQYEYLAIISQPVHCFILHHTMRLEILFAPALAAFVRAAGVTGAAEGFAKGVTGGGSATAVTPTTTAQLVSYLGDSSARVIILDRTFDFTGTEGTTTATGCAPYGTASACQLAINKDDWCTNYQPNAPKVSAKLFFCWV